jgi:hypothetical protein
MAAVPGKQAAGQIVQLMNISGVRIFLQKAQKPFRKDPVAGHIGVVEKLKQKVIEKIGNILPLYNDVQKKRHLIKPGITGWAQINGRNAVEWEKNHF